MKKLLVFGISLVLMLNAMLGVCFAATYKSITISPGQSWEFVNKSSTGAGILQRNKGKYDFASYNKDGTVDSAYCLEEGVGYVEAGERAVITVPSTSGAITFEYDSEKISVATSSTQALKKVVIKPGTSYEFVSTSSKDEYIKQYGKELYDYIAYKSDGSIYTSDVETSGWHFLPQKGRGIVTVPAGFPAVTFYSASDYFNKNFTYKEVSEPALYKINIKPGETYNIKNTSTSELYIRSKNWELYDYITYKADGTEQYSGVSSSGGEFVSAGCSLVISLLPTSDNEILYMPYDVYKSSASVSQSSNPALYKVNIYSGESYEFKNVGSEESKVFVAWHEYFETALYNKDDTLSTADDSNLGTQYIRPGERLIVTVPDYSEMISYYIGYDKYETSVKVEASYEPALHKIAVLPGQSFEFKNIGSDYAGIKESGSETFTLDTYSKTGQLTNSNDSYSGYFAVSPGWKSKVTVPQGSKAVAFYTGFEAYKKCFDPSIVPGVGFSFSKNLSQAKDKAEVLKVLETSYALLSEKGKESNNIKEYSVRFAEEAIKKISSKEIKATDNVAEIESSIVKEQVEKAKEAATEVEGILEKSGIEKNRDIKTSIKIDVVAAETKNTDLVINKDLSKDAQEVDIVDFSTGDVGISLETSTLDQEFANGDKITISVNEEEQTNLGMKNIVLASNLTDMGVLGLEKVAGNKTYAISFKAQDGKEIKSLNNNVGLSLPAASDNGDYDCIFMVDNGKTEAVGGRYDSDTNKLNIQTKKSAEYYVVENKKSFSDIGKKDADMRKAIEIMAAKGIINGKSDGKFEPDASINRSEFATLIVRAIYKYTSDSNYKFSDVEAKAWYYPFIASAKNEGIISGYPDNTFKPLNVINKQEIITICSSVLNKQKGFYYPTDVNKYLNFSDKSNIPEWAKKAIALANREGLITKRRDEKLIGDQPFTRGDAAVILYRLFNKL